MGLNGTTAKDLADIRKRYFTQWITEQDKTKGGLTHLKVLGWCIRDRNTRDWATVFEHESHDVCQKLANILNEG